MNVLILLPEVEKLRQLIQFRPTNCLLLSWKTRKLSQSLHEDLPNHQFKMETVVNLTFEAETELV